MPSASIFPLLRRPGFRGLWGGSAIYFIGNAMQAMAASWLMVELIGSSFLAAPVQTAVFLPMFLLSLPAGVLADTTDRRRLILAALAVQAVTVILLSALVLAGVAGSGSLLFFTFIAGCCTAIFSHSSTPPVRWSASSRPLGATAPRTWCCGYPAAAGGAAR